MFLNLLTPSGVTGEFSSTAEDLAKRDAHCIFFAEHLATPKQVTEFKTTLRASSWSAQASCLDPEKGHQSAGVGGMVRDPFRIFEIQPTSPALAAILSNGRVGMYGCDIGNNTHATIFCVYGWTGGHTCDTAAARTDGIFAAIGEELVANNRTNVMIVGDFNCSVERLPHLVELCERFHFTDTGAVAARWGGQDGEVTCVAPNSAAGSRNDYIFLAPELVPLVKFFKLIWHSDFAVHCVLQLGLTMSYRAQRKVNHIPPSMSAALHTHFNATLPPLQDGNGNERDECWQKYLGTFQQEVRTSVNTHQAHFREQVDQGLTQGAWETWSSAIESAFLKIVEADPGAASSRHRGRGKPHFKCWTDTKPPPIIVDGRTTSSLNKESRRLLKQSRRLLAWADRVAAPRRQRTAADIFNRHQMALFSAQSIVDNSGSAPFEAELLEFLRDNWEEKSTIVLLTTLRKFQCLYFTSFKYSAHLLKSEVREARAKSVTDDTHNKLAWKKVRGKFSPPLLFVARDQVGPDLQPVGSISTDPAEVDSIVTRIWTKIYDGNVSPANVFMHMVTFFAEFICYVFCRTTFHLEPFSGADLFQACVHGPKTAGGMDGWAPDDWSLLPEEAFEEVAYLLRAVEEGAPWPTGILHGRAVFLAKTEVPSLDPLKYRVLLVLPLCHRKWAAVRLSNLAPWIAQWRQEELYAGMPGVGA